MNKILINAGSSGRGWSFRAGLVGLCAQEWAYRQLLGGEGKPSPPLIKGSLVHIGCAHHNARLQAMQNGWDAERYYSPVEALELLADEEDLKLRDRGMRPAWAEHVPIATKALMRKMEEDDKRRLTQGWSPEIVAVEHRMVGWFDETGMVDAPANAAERLALLESSDPADWLAYWRQGAPYVHTARADWIERRNGFYYVVDAKTGYKADAVKTSGYQMSGQFAGLDAFARAAYGDLYGGIEIEFILFTGKVTRVPILAPPWIRANFGQTVVDSENRLGRLLEEGRDPWRFPKSMSEQTCIRRYGPRCPFFEKCAHGP